MTSGKRHVILASASAARREVLAQLGLPFTVEVSMYEEDMTKQMSPRQMVRLFSREKARNVARRHTDALVIGADSIVVLAGRKLGKPKNKADAKRVLHSLSGRTHYGLTGLTVIDAKSNKEISRVVSKAVRFKKLSTKDINGYVASGEPLGHAGSYAIQGKGAALVKNIKGDYYNVAGLPVSVLAEMLKEFGISVF